MAAKKKMKKGTAKKAAPKKAVKKIAKKAVKKAVKAAKKGVLKAKKKASAKKSLPLKAKAPAPSGAKAPKNLQAFLTPLDDRVVVRLSGADKRTAGGLYIPDTVSDVSGNLRGHVVAVGRGHRDDKGRLRPMDLALGDQVIFAEFSGSKIKIQNEDFIILREAEVMGVVSK